MASKNSYRLSFEQLEARNLPAGGFMSSLVAVAMPEIQVNNLPMATQGILPGASNKVLTDMVLSTGRRQYARLEEMLFLPAYGSEPLAQNTRQFTLRADLNGKPQDGCEAVIGYAQADPGTDILDFTVFRPTWIRQKPLHMQVVADFQSYLSGDAIGLELALAVFRNLRNQPVDDSNVFYTGADPVLHTMENAVFSVYQLQMNSAANVLAGSKNIPLIQFGAWENNAIPGTVAFTALQGNLQLAGNYTLVHKNWQGVVDSTFKGAVSGNELSFSFGANFPNTGGTFEVDGDISSNTSGVFQLGFLASSMNATNATTGISLRGLMVNGVGEGQVQIRQSPDFATTYTIVVPAASGLLTAETDGTSPVNMAVAGGQQVTAAKFKLTATGDSFTVTQAVFTVAPSAASVIISVTLWDGSIKLETQPFDPAHGNFSFTGLSVPVAANSTKVLVVSLDLVTPYTDGNIVTTGVNAKVTMTSLTALNSVGISGTQTVNASGNNVYVYKSLPTFTVSSLPAGQGLNLSSGATTSLYKFNVTADAKGLVSLKQIQFGYVITITGGNHSPSLDNFKLFRGTTDITSTVRFQMLSGRVVVTFTAEEAIPPGQSYDYTLKATPHGFATGDSVFTMLPGDSSPFAGISSSTGGYLAGASIDAILALATQSGQTSGTVANVIWSDNSANIHNDTVGASSSDWFNGYLVNNLPLDVIGVTAQ